MIISRHVWVVLFYSSLNVTFVDCVVDVHLYEYKQSDSLTKCEDGLIEGDRLIVYGEVTATDIENVENDVKMIVNIPNSDIFFKTRFSRRDLDSEYSRNYFVRNYNVFLFVLNDTARIDLSTHQGTLRLFQWQKGFLKSNEIKLPIITRYKKCSKIELIGCPVVAEEDMNITCKCKLVSNIYAESNVKWITHQDEKYFHNEAAITFTANRSFKGYTCIASVIQTSENFSSAYRPLIIYKAQSLTCTKMLDNQDGLNISCFTEKIYPQAKCLFAIINYQGDQSYKGILTYRHEKRGDNPEYFASQCNVYLNNSHVPEGGIYNFTIIMYPKGNRAFDTYNFGVEKSILFSKVIFSDRPINCSSTSKHELNIACIASNIFPKALCHFNILFNNIPYLEGNVLYIHTQVTENPAYYTSVCSLFIPYTKLESGLYVLNVSIYPNVSEEFIDNVPTRFWSFHLAIETPRLKIENCTSNISEGQTVLCKCKGNADVFIQESIQWYKNMKELVSNGTDLEIRNATGNKDEYTCRALDAKYRKLYSVTFELTVSLNSMSKSSRFLERLSNSILSLLDKQHTLFPHLKDIDCEY